MGILLGEGDFDGAISMAEPFLSEDPDNDTIAPLKGLALYSKGDYEPAVKVFQRQEDIGNDSYPIHYYLGQSYWHTLVIYRAEQELLAAWEVFIIDTILDTLDGLGPFFCVFRFFHESQFDHVVEIGGRRYGLTVFEDGTGAGITFP